MRIKKSAHRKNIDNKIFAHYFSTAHFFNLKLFNGFVYSSSDYKDLMKLSIFIIYHFSIKQKMKKVKIA